MLVFVMVVGVVVVDEVFFVGGRRGGRVERAKKDTIFTDPENFCVEVEESNQSSSIFFFFLES